MKKTAVMVMIMVVVIFAFATGCSADITTTTTTTTETSTTTTTTETPTNGLKFEELPEATTATTAPDYTEELEEIYDNLGLEHVCWFDKPKIEGNVMYISSIDDFYGPIQAICPTVSFLESHDIEFFGKGIEKSEADVVPDGAHVEGATVAIFESDEEHVIIRWDGKMKMVIDNQYIVVFNPTK